MMAWPRRKRTRKEPVGRRETEKGFMQAVIELATWTGWKYYHTHDSRRSPEGFLDLVLVHDEEPVIYAELKRARRKPTAAQRDWIEALRRAKWTEVYMWTPDDWPFIEQRLSRRLKRRKS